MIIKKIYVIKKKKILKYSEFNLLFLSYPRVIKELKMLVLILKIVLARYCFEIAIRGR